MALDIELQRRGLEKENAVWVKKRLDALSAREEKGLLVNQVAAAKYERNMRHFVGWEEPKFDSRYVGRDIRRLFARIRHKYRVCESVSRPHRSLDFLFNMVSFPVLECGNRFRSRRFHLARGTQAGGGWSFIVAIGCVLAVLGARDFGARLMRKLDWKRYGR